MTRTLFRSLLIALCLTALTSVPARSDSWFKFAGSKKKSKEAAVEVESAPITQVSDDDDDDDCDCIECQRGNKRACRKLARQNKEFAKQARKQTGEVVATGGVACYPALKSSLYPCPKPDVPVEVGQTIITNQAFYPHEMLYPHCYRALYPPYYYENKCFLGCLPFVPQPRLVGTMVTVKYKTCLPFGFKPPQTTTYGGRGNIFR